MLSRTLSVLSGFLCLVTSAGAGPLVMETAGKSSPFDKGSFECQLGAGAFTSLQDTSVLRPHFVDIDGTARWGVMLNSPAGDGFFGGNFEFMVEGYGAALINGTGTGYGGVGLILRYNFVHVGNRLVPYFQSKIGGVYNDVSVHQEQHAFGRAEEFDLGAGPGLRYFCNDRIALFGEGDYRHISDANTARRNLGLNAIGGFFGVSLFY